MRTGRSLTVCCSLLGAGGDGLPGRGGVLLGPGGGGLPGPGGSAWSGRVLLGPGGVLLGPRGGGGGLPGPGGVSAWSGGVVSAWSRGGGVPETYPLWTEFLPHACENITLAQLRCGR